MGADVNPGQRTPDWLSALDAELRRVPDRVRNLNPAGLAGIRGHAHTVAQTLGDVAAGIEARDLPQPPASRTLPRLADRALGDQLAVTGTDVLLAASDVPPGCRVWAGEGRVAVEEAVRAAVDELSALRRA